MKNIAIMGLVSWENYGEQFLAKSAAYLVGKEHNIRFIDFEPPTKGIGELLYWCFLVLARLLPYKQWKHKLIYVGVQCRSRAYFKKMMTGCEQLIFACGSYKYGTQKLWAYYSVAIELAEKMNIPVMFNGVNVQDFDEKDWRCMCLKEHTNYSCVKVFTTRDGESGLEKLHRSYIENQSIKVMAVGDPAFWIPECYSVARKENGNVIGINLIRGRIFSDYGKSMTEEQLLQFYCDLIQLYEKSGLEWELFTNGMRVDYTFGKKVLEKCGMSERVIKVPQTDRELVELIAGYKAIVGARLHACICAYSLDVPLVGFVWDEKMLRFSEITGLSECFLEEQELTGNNVFERMKRVMSMNYNVELRTEWKEKTRKSIQDFVANI